MAAASKGEMDTYGKAGAIAEEVLSSIRTVVAFGGQKKELENYSLALKEAKKHSIIKGRYFFLISECEIIYFEGTLTLSTIGLMFGLIYAAYGLAFWYGCKLVMDYREKPEYMECLAQCLVPDENGEIGGLDCFLNCDRSEAYKRKSRPVHWSRSQVHSWFRHHSHLWNPQWRDADRSVQHVRRGRGHSQGGGSPDIPCD